MATILPGQKVNFYGTEGRYCTDILVQWTISDAEKKVGVILISKLRAILLMEEDFNAANNIVYGNQMLANVRKYSMMPEDIFSYRNRMADYGGLAKILFYDIVRQQRVPAGIASVDAANCYDRVAHSIASLVFQSFRV